MNNAIDLYRDLSYIRKAEGAERREQAMLDYPEAASAAELAGLRLRQISEAHYQLGGPGWTLNAYPGNCRIAKCRGSAPRFRVRGPWTLADVVAAATDAMKGTP